MCDLVIIGFVAGHRSDVEFVFQYSFYSCVIPQVLEADLWLIAAEIFAEELLLIIGGRFYSLFIKDTGYGRKAIALKIHIE